MKKIIVTLSIVLAFSCLTAFGIVKMSDTEEVVECTLSEKKKDKTEVDFYFGVGTRFMGYSKEQLSKFTTFNDFLPIEQIRRIEEIKSVNVILIEDDEQTAVREMCNGEVLNASQLSLLQSADYSTNFLVGADCMLKNPKTGKLEETYFSPYCTIVPEKETTYEKGMDAIVSYLRTNTEEEIKVVKMDKLTPAKVYFTVTKTGSITNVKLSKTTGYSSIDNKVVDLIKELSGKWNSAENAKGEKIDQELVCFFGLAGC